MTPSTPLIPEADALDQFTLPDVPFALPMSQEVLEALPFPFSIYTCDGLYIGANDLVEQLFGVPKSAIVGAFNILNDPITQDIGAHELFHAAVAGQRGIGAPLYYDFSFPGTKHQKRVGCWIQVTYMPFRDAAGQVTHVGTLIQDVTERVESAQETTRLKTLIENASDGIAMTDLTGHITYCNPAYQTLTGYGEAVLGMNITAVHPEEVNTIASSAAQLQTRGHWRGRLMARHADGSKFPTEVSAFMLPERNGQPGGMGAILRDLRERQAQEQRLRMFEILVEQVPTGIVITDLEGRVTYANEAVCHTYGYGNATASMRIPELIAPAHRAEFGPKMAELMANGEMSTESAFICRDGSVRPIAVDALLIRDAQGTPQATAAIIRDLTEERAREQELRLTKFSLDRSPDNIHWIDPSSAIIYVNDGACADLGYTREELEQMTIADIDHTFSLQNWDMIWNQLKQQGVMKFETLHRRKDGSTMPVDITANFLEFEGREVGCVMARDISERKRVEADLRTFKALVENAPDAIGVADMTGAIIYCNPAYQVLLGYGAEIIGKSGFDFIVAADRAIATQALANLPEERVVQLHLRYQRKDGGIFPATVSIFIQETPGGDTQVIGFIRDISEQKRAEEERTALQEQAIAAQQAALRELSTPLIPIADGVIAMPLIGTIDSSRAQLVIETLLTGVAEMRAHTTIIDITGVPVVDTQVANALLRAAQAIKLLGARVILTGIRPEVAQTLVGLGVDLSGIITRGTLQSGIADALGRLASASSNSWR